MHSLNLIKFVWCTHIYITTFLFLVFAKVSLQEKNVDFPVFNVIVFETCQYLKVSTWKLYLFLEHQYQPVPSFLLTAAILVYPYLQLKHCMCTLHK